jgi:DNA-nicking Smr family endonuclease
MAKGRGDTNSGKHASHAANHAKGPAPADSDAALWRKVAENIKPLKARRRAAVKPATPPAPVPVAAQTAKPRVAIVAKPQPATQPVLPELLPGVTAGVDKRTAQRLGRGQLAIEARLDLHGLTQDEAHAKLAGFIRRSVAAGKRCVLIITGKGFKPTGETGVLRKAVPRWLNEASMRRDIVALRHAQPQDGGEGALYVLLRRDRAAPSTAKDARPKRLARKSVKP